VLVLFFIFQIDSNKTIDLSNEIANNKLTLQSNKISWNYLSDAKSYQVSYDNKNWIDTIFNYFIADEDKLIKDENGRTFIYLRYINNIGITQDSYKIEVFNNIKKIKAPIVTTDNDVLINNNKVTFKITIPDAINSNFIYYSFDKINWNVKPVTGTVEYIDLDKTDKVKVTPVQGAVYTIINPEGVVVEDVTTDENGVAVSKELSKDFNAGKISCIKQKDSRGREQEIYILTFSQGKRVLLSLKQREFNIGKTTDSSISLFLCHLK